MTSNGFPSQCSSCGRTGVRIIKSEQCPKCKRANRYCMGCSAAEVNGMRKTSCRCQWRKKRSKQNPFK